MIDRALGLEPAKRRRVDNVSETSSTKNAVTLTLNSPLKPPPKRNLDQEQLLDDPLAKNHIQTSPNKPPQTSETPLKFRKSHLKHEQSEHKVKEMVVQNIRIAKAPMTVQDMKNSNKFHLVESAKQIQQRAFERTNPTQQGDGMYKLKVLIFLLISIGAILFTMTPNRKGDGRKSSNPIKTPKKSH